MDPDHQTNSAFAMDQYSSDFSPTGRPEDNWRLLVSGHPCYNPAKVRGCGACMVVVRVHVRVRHVCVCV